MTAEPKVQVRVHKRRFTWWAQIDGTFYAGGALRFGDGRERAIRRALDERRRALAAQDAHRARSAAAEVVVRQAS